MSFCRPRLAANCITIVNYLQFLFVHWQVQRNLLKLHKSATNKTNKIQIINNLNQNKLIFFSSKTSTKRIILYGCHELVCDLLRNNWITQCCICLVNKNVFSTFNAPSVSCKLQVPNSLRLQVEIIYCHLKFEYKIKKKGLSNGFLTPMEFFLQSKLQN